MKIFIDMDGVLVDFQKGASDFINGALESGQDYGSKSLGKLLQLDAQGNVPDITPEYLSYLLQLKDSKSPRTKVEKAVSNAVFSATGVGGSNWWANLPQADGARELIDTCIAMVGIQNVYIMTAPTDDASIDGKIIWINKNFPQIDDVTNMFVSHEKGDYVSSNNPGKCILIDDRIKYTTQWQEAGGFPVLHDPPASTQGVRNSLNAIRNYILEVGE